MKNIFFKHLLHLVIVNILILLSTVCVFSKDETQNIHQYIDELLKEKRISESELRSIVKAGIDLSPREISEIKSLSKKMKEKQIPVQKVENFINAFNKNDSVNFNCFTYMLISMNEKKIPLDKFYESMQYFFEFEDPLKSFFDYRDINTRLKNYDLSLQQIDTAYKFIYDLPCIFPVQDTVQKFSSEMADSSDNQLDNEGIILKVNHTQKVRATASGVVVYAGEAGGFSKKYSSLSNKIVMIRHKYSFSTVYGNLVDCTIKSGMTVAKGQVLGSAGADQGTKKPYLFYSILLGDEPIDPALMWKSEE